MKNICVYCSSSNDIDTIFFDIAEELAVKLVNGGHTLVFGGGNVGLMGELAKTVEKMNGKSIGVIPQKLKDLGVCYEQCSTLIITSDMRKRKEKMEELSDGFIAMPGGFGTLEEIFEMITAKQIGFHDKPLVFLNINDFYSPLFEFFEKIYNLNFAKSSMKTSYFITDSPEKAVEYIENYQKINKTSGKFILS